VKTTAIIFLLIVQVILVAGQVFVKHGMNLTHQSPRPRGRIAANMTAGIGMLALWFCLWMGLLQKLDLSYAYPFEGLSPVLIVLASWVMLKEETSWRLWLGVGLISAGTTIVGFS